MRHRRGRGGEGATGNQNGLLEGRSPCWHDWRYLAIAVGGADDILVWAGLFVQVEGARSNKAGPNKATSAMTEINFINLPWPTGLSCSRRSLNERTEFERSSLVGLFR